MHVGLFLIKRAIFVIWPDMGIIVYMYIFVIYVKDHIIMWVYLGYSARDDPREQVSGKVTTGPDTRLGASQGVFWLIDIYLGYWVMEINIWRYI